MRSTLLAGAAVGAFCLAVPSISQVEASKASAPFDPLAYLSTICKTPSGEPRLLGRFLQAAAAYAATTPSDGSGPPPLILGVASGVMEATVNEAARPYFQQGMGLVDGFNHMEGVRAFRAAQTLDPGCAMCFWGESYALGPNINKVMDPADNPRAVEAAKLALEKAASASEVERALIEALQARYSDAPDADRAALDAAYADAMQAVADRFPEHDQVQALAAEAIMDAQPWDYWEPGGRVPKGRADLALARTEAVLARNPDHVLSIHLHIHLTEASNDPWRSLPYAARLGSLTPGAGHLVHMPGHTWFRVGMFEESLDANVVAVAVNEAYLAAAGDAASDMYRYGYYPHNLHFVMTSAQRAGAGDVALAMAERLDAALPMEMADMEGWIQYVKYAPWTAQLQFGGPEALAALLAEPAPETDLPLIQAAWHYVRGEAAARHGDVETARAEAQALSELAAATDWAAAVPWTPAADVVAIMQHLVRARAAMAAGDAHAAIDDLVQASDIQSTIQYTEPPFWWYPVRQTLGAALLMDGQAERAEQQFFATLVENPDDAWAYWGLAEARAARGDAVGAEAARALFERAWLGDEPPSLDRL
jgi:hypothetical protein